MMMMMMMMILEQADKFQTNLERAGEFQKSNAQIISSLRPRNAGVLYWKEDRP
jgi:hypothetical protein